MTRLNLEDCLDLAEEQGWRQERTTKGGYKLFPPIGRCQPGYDMVVVYPPHKDNRHSLDEIYTRLRRAGLKFPELKPNRGDVPMDTKSGSSKPEKPSAPSVIGATLGGDDFELLRRKIELAMTALSDIEQIGARIQDKAKKAQQLRAMLKDFAE